MAIPTKDAVIPEDAPNSPMLDEHARFILKYDEDKEEYEFVMSEFLRINAVYWALTAMELMGQRDKIDREEVSNGGGGFHYFFLFFWEQGNCNSNFDVLRFEAGTSTEML